MLLNPNEKVRLIQLSPGADTDDLIEELFSMAGDTQRQQFPNGIDLTPADPTLPPITGNFPNTNAAQNLMKFTRGNNELTIGFNPDNSLNVNLNGAETTVGAAAGAGASNVFPARVDAYLGSNSYQVTIYPAGLSSTGQSVTAIQLEGDPAWPQRADGTRYTFVVKAGNEYYMNMPVWIRHT